jgi:SAM-dependent methyltransferase
MLRDDLTAMSSDQYSMSHPKGIGRFYWHVARNTILLKEIEPFLDESATVLDIGAGPGVVVDFLRSKGVNCFGVDVGTPEPDSERVAPFLFLGQSAFDLDDEFRQQVRVVLLMDVLEHLPEPERFLQECQEAFPNVSTLAITVPTGPEIWSNYDEYYGHFRRYTLDSIADLTERSGLKLVKSAYFFHALYWAALFMKRTSKPRAVRILVPRWPSLHAILGRAFVAEARVIPDTARGSSAFAILQRV